MKIQLLYKKNEEIFKYIVTGALTTLVSLTIYYILVETMLNPKNSIELQIANITSWIAAVIFAFHTNKVFVFKNKEKRGNKSNF